MLGAHHEERAKQAKFNKKEEERALRKAERTKILDGQALVSCRTLGSMYDQNSVEFKDDAGQTYRLPARMILRMVNEFSFTVEKAIKHWWVMGITRKGDV